MRNWKLPIAIFLGLTTLTWAAGKLQNSDFATSAQITGAGGVVSQLLNTSKIYDSTNAQLLDTTIAAKFNTSAFTDAAVTGKLITGYVSGAGVVAATDTILQAIQKLNGNIAAGSVPDGDKGDITVTASGATWTIDNLAVTNAKIATMTDGTLKSNISGGAASPSDNTLSAILDYVFGSAQGSVLYRGAAVWNDLAPGTAGYQLTTNGAGADPTWTAAGGAGTVGDWTAYTPTFGAGWGTNTNVSFFYKEVGDSLKVRGTFTSGTLVAGFLSISLPGGYTIDSAKISIGNTDANEGEAVGTIGTSVANQHAPIVTATGSSTSIVYSGATFNVASHLVPAGLQFSSGAHTTVAFEVPIN